MVSQLLVQTLKEPTATFGDARPSEGATASTFGVDPVIEEQLAHIQNLPMDLFTLVFMCLPIEQEKEVLEMRLGIQRVGAYILYEFQSVLWQWLIAMHAEALRDLRGRSHAGSTVVRMEHLQILAVFANSMLVCVEQCDDINTRPLPGASQDANGASDDLLGKDVLPVEWSLTLVVSRFHSLSEAFTWVVCDFATVRWRSQVTNSNENLTSLLRSHLGGSLQLLRNCLKCHLFENFLQKVFYVCLGSYLSQVARKRESPVPDDQLRQDAGRLDDFFQSFSSADHAPWQQACVLDIMRNAGSLAHLGQKGRDPISLSRLREITQKVSEGPLQLVDLSDLRDVLSSPFEQLPPPAPPGLKHIPAGTANARSGGASRNSAVERWNSLESCSQKKADGAVSPQALEGGASGFITAAEGGVCDLRVDDTGVYGLFCNVVRFEGAPREGSASPSKSRVGPVQRRRWTQLAKPKEGPRLEIFRSFLREDALEVIALSRLRSASCPGQSTTTLHLSFSIDEAEDGCDTLEYTLFFDCPSNLYHIKLVLDAWWGKQSIPVPPIAALRGDIDSSWDNSLVLLTQKGLQERFGRLWSEVKPELSSVQGVATAPVMR